VLILNAINRYVRYSFLPDLFSPLIPGKNNTDPNLKTDLLIQPKFEADKPFFNPVLRFDQMQNCFEKAKQFDGSIHRVQSELNS